jgi:hypothetical protein
VSSNVNSIEIAPKVRLTGAAGDDAGDRELHASDGANLPALCVDCGTPVQGSPDVRVYRGFAPGAWWLFLFKAGTRQLIIRLFGRKVKIGAFVCNDHVSSRRTRRLVGLIGAVVMLPLAIALRAAGLSSGVCSVIFVLGTLISLAVRWGAMDLLNPKGITGERIAVFRVPNDKFMQAAQSQKRAA